MKNFSIFKNTHKKEGSTAPDYKISAKVGEEYVEAGACWLKDSPKGGKYFSCKLNDYYADNKTGTARPGFELTMDELEKAPEVKKPNIDPITGIDCNDSPF